MSGKGFAAGLVAAGLRASVRAHLEHIRSPAELAPAIARVNVDLVHDTLPTQFATMFVGLIARFHLAHAYGSSPVHRLALLNRGGRRPRNRKVSGGLQCL